MICTAHKDCEAVDYDQHRTSLAKASENHVSHRLQALVLAMDDHNLFGGDLSESSSDDESDASQHDAVAEPSFVKEEKFVSSTSLLLSYRGVPEGHLLVGIYWIILSNPR